MRKIHKGLIIAGAVAITLSVAFFVLFNLNTFMGKSSSQPDLSETHTTYKISPERCEGILGCEIEDFFASELILNGIKNDFREYAEIDKEGNLILRLSAEQEKILQQKIPLQTSIEELQSKKNIQLASDLSQVIIYCYDETVYSDITSLMFAFRSIVIEQLLKYKSTDAINLDIILKDGVTGETVYNVSWPKEKFEYDSEKYEFSSIKQNS